MKLQEVSVPLCTAGEEKLAGEPGGRKDWSRRQSERAAEMPPAIHTTRKRESIEKWSKSVRKRATEADGKTGIKINYDRKRYGLEHRGKVVNEQMNRNGNLF